MISRLRPFLSFPPLSLSSLNVSLFKYVKGIRTQQLKEGEREREMSFRQETGYPTSNPNPTIEQGVVTINTNVASDSDLAPYINNPNTLYPLPKGRSLSNLHSVREGEPVYGERTRKIKSQLARNGLSISPSLPLVTATVNGRGDISDTTKTLAEALMDESDKIVFKGLAYRDFDPYAQENAGLAVQVGGSKSIANNSNEVYNTGDSIYWTLPVPGQTYPDVTLDTKNGRRTLILTPIREKVHLENLQTILLSNELGEINVDNNDGSFANLLRRSRSQMAKECVDSIMMMAVSGLMYCMKMPELRKLITSIVTGEDELENDGGAGKYVELMELLLNRKNGPAQDDTISFLNNVIANKEDETYSNNMQTKFSYASLFTMFLSDSSGLHRAMTSKSASELQQIQGGVIDFVGFPEAKRMTNKLSHPGQSTLRMFIHAVNKYNQMLQRHKVGVIIGAPAEPGRITEILLTPEK